MKHCPNVVGLEFYEYNEMDYLECGTSIIG